MGTEQKGINEALNLSIDFGDPHLGRRRKDLLPYDKAEMKFAVGCLGNEDFRLQANDIMTRSMRCQGTLGKPGDIMVVEQAHTFDKDGACHLMIKYVEYAEEKKRRRRRKV